MATKINKTTSAITQLWFCNQNTVFINKLLLAPFKTTLTLKVSRLRSNKIVNQKQHQRKHRSVSFTKEIQKCFTENGEKFTKFSSVQSSFTFTFLLNQTKRKVMFQDSISLQKL